MRARAENYGNIRQPGKTTTIMLALLAITTIGTAYWLYTNKKIPPITGILESIKEKIRRP